VFSRDARDQPVGRPVNLLWLADITEQRIAEGTMYFCAITDVHAERYVGDSIDSRTKASLAASAFRSAITRRKPRATVVHSRR
jgi:transposase InsO family protein